MRSRSAEMSLKSFGRLMTHGQGKWFCPLSKLLSTGNNKLPRITAIFNMSSAHNCPSLKRGLCRAYAKDGRHVCYARKAETTMYAAVEPHRESQMKFWLSTTAEDFSWQFLLINALKEVPYTALRMNEAGDFHSQDCVDKAERIATILSGYGIKVYGYTARSDLDYSKVKHMIISGSGFQKKGIANVFMMVEDVEWNRPRGWGICNGNCRTCNRCQVRGNKTVVKRH